MSTGTIGFPSNGTQTFFTSGVIGQTGSGSSQVQSTQSAWGRSEKSRRRCCGSGVWGCRF